MPDIRPCEAGQARTGSRCLDRRTDLAGILPRFILVSWLRRVRPGLVLYYWPCAVGPVLEDHGR